MKRYASAGVWCFPGLVPSPLELSHYPKNKLGAHGRSLLIHPNSAPLNQPQATANVLSSLRICLFWAFRVNEIVRAVPCDWHLSLGITSPKVTENLTAVSECLHRDLSWDSKPARLDVFVLRLKDAGPKSAHSIQMRRARGQKKRHTLGKQPLEVRPPGSAKSASRV